jgi:hypothetical protein
MSNLVNIKNHKFRYQLNTPLNYQGGKEVIYRLLHLFGVNNKIELGDLLGITPGTFATWQTRKTTPYELLVRVHLATGVSMEYLCFGEGDQNQDVLAKSYGSTIPVYKDGEAYVPADVAEKAASYKLPAIKSFSIENGQLIPTSEFVVDEKLIAMIGFDAVEADKAIHENGGLAFINSKENTPTQGRYLFSIGDICQLGELRLLPDRIVYYVVGQDKYPIDPNTTTVHGKVVSILQSV